jgi:hypothetical protein
LRYDIETFSEYIWNLIIVWGPRVLAAILILLVTHFLAKGVKWGLAKLVDSIPFLKRNQAEAEADETLGLRLGTLAYWIVWLVGLVLALQPLGLSEVVAPVNQLTDRVFSYIPNILGAALIFFIGLVLARIVRRLVESALSAVNAEALAARAGLTKITGTTSESIIRALGIIAFVLVIIPISIAALEALALYSVTDPAIRLLDTVLVQLPRVLAAAIILSLAFFIGKWVANLTEQLLAATGVDEAMASLAAFPARFKASRAAGILVLTAIMLFAAVEAARALEFTEMSFMLAEVVELGGRVLFGSVIIVVGVMLANIVANAISRSTGETGFAPMIAKYAIVALATAMGLRFMGLANDIVNLAFGLILGAAAVAAAIAFGIGGRSTAHELLQHWLEEAKRKNPPKDDQ